MADQPQPPHPFVVVRGETSPDHTLDGAVLAIGNFDGVHRGHRAVIAAALARAQTLGRPAAALTFEPHPRGFFRPNEPLFRLTDERSKLRLLATTGLDGAIVLRFDAALAGLSAAGFRHAHSGGAVCRRRRRHRLRFSFRSQPRGFARISRGAGCEARLRGRYRAARSKTRDGRFAPARSARRLPPVKSREANELLGYPWFVSAEVVHGDKRGRELGYPTANLRLDPGCGLKHGIYAVRVGVARGVTMASPASDGGRCSTRARCCSKSSCSILPAISMARLWTSPSSTGSGRSSNSTASRTSSAAWTRIRGARAPCWRRRRTHSHGWVVCRP